MPSDCMLSFTSMTLCVVEMLWWPERESNPRHEDFQWRVAKFPKHFPLVAKIKSRCARECANALEQCGEHTRGRLDTGVNKREQFTLRDGHVGTYFIPMAALWSLFSKT